MLGLFCAACDRRPFEGLEFDIRVSAWLLGLSDIPTADLMDVAKAEMAERIDPFFPKPADLVRRFKGVDDDGEAVVVANQTAYRPVPPTRNELIHKGIIAPDDPTPAYARPSGPDARALETPRYNADNFKSADQLRDELDAKINTALWERGRMETFRVAREKRVAFGRWLHARQPLKTWTPEIVRAAWHEWQCAAPEN